MNWFKMPNGDPCAYEMIDTDQGLYLIAFRVLAGFVPSYVLQLVERVGDTIQPVRVLDSMQCRACTTVEDAQAVCDETAQQARELLVAMINTPGVWEGAWGKGGEA